MSNSPQSLNDCRDAYLKWRKTIPFMNPLPHELNQEATQWDRGAWLAWQAAWAESQKHFFEVVS